MSNLRRTGQVVPLSTSVRGGLSAGSLLCGYDVVVCNSCGFGFADKVPPQAEFDAYYREMSKYEHQDRGGVEAPDDLQRLERLAAIVMRVKPDRSARILDVGCSTGGLLASLKQAGYANLQASTLRVRARQRRAAYTT